MRLLRWGVVVFAVVTALHLAPVATAHAVVAPFTFSAQENGLGQVRLVWGAGTGVTSYAIYRSDSHPAPLPGQAEPIWQGSAEASGWVDVPPLSDGLYWYRLVAFGAEGAYATRTDGVKLGDNLFGHAFTANGAPLSGIEVIIYPRALQTNPAELPLARLVTDENGSFSYKLSGGFYVLFRDPSGNHMDEWWGGSHEFKASSHAHIASDYSIALIDGYMDPPTMVSGTIRSNFTRGPVTGGRVVVRQASPSTIPTGGSYREWVTEVEASPDGFYQVRLDAGRGYSLDVFTDDHGSMTTGSFDLAWGDRITKDIWMTPTYDHVPPATRLTADASWRTAPARVWFQASDDRSGVASSHYSLNGSVETTYAGPISFLSSGVYELRFRSVDAQGNREPMRTAEIRIDAEPPLVNASIAQRSVGEAALVSIDAVDALSGVAGVFVRIDDRVRRYSGPFTISSPVTAPIEWWAVDSAGNKSDIGSRRLFVGTANSAPPQIGDPGDTGRWSWSNDGSLSGLADADIDLSESLQLAATAETITVAFIGSGIYLDDDDLRGRTWVNEDEVADNGVDDDMNGHVDDLHGVRFDSNGVGQAGVPLWSALDGWRMTTLASIVAGERGNGYGVSGIAQNARIMCLPVLTELDGAHFRRWAPDAAVDAAIRYAVDNGAGIIQLEALGGTRDGLCYAAQRGVLVIAPAVGSPDWMPVGADTTNTVIVSATNRRDTLADYEQKGQHVDLSAPGESPGTAPPRYAGLYVEKQPYRLAYLSVSAERAALPSRSDLIADALETVAPDKSTPVLIVDASPYTFGAAYEAAGARTAAYVEAVAARGYSRYSVFPGVQPSAADMAGKTVIYFGGVDYPHKGVQNINWSILAELAKFLDGGGSLVFVSGEFGKYKSNGWIGDYDDFYATYMRAIYLGESDELAYTGRAGTLFGGKDFVQRETVFDEPEMIWPVDASARPILEWPRVVQGKGASIAAAHVSGVAALTWGVHPDWGASQVRSRILDTADRLPQLRDVSSSGARLNAYSALSASGAPNPRSHHTAITIHASDRHPIFGRSVVISGQVTQAGIPLKNADVGLQQIGGANSGQVVATASTGESGIYRFMVTPAESTSYRTVMKPVSHLHPLPSSSVTIKPRATLTRPRAPISVRRGVSFTVSGSLDPLHAPGFSSVRLKCYRLESGKWRLRKTFTAPNRTSGGSTRYSRAIALPSPGRWRIAATHSDAGHSPSRSSYHYIKVR